MLVCESESEIVSVSVLSLRWWQAHIARLQTPPPWKAAPTPLVEREEEEEEEDEDEEEGVKG